MTEDNNRKHSRLSYSTSVELLLNDGTRQPGILENISQGGAFVKTDNIPAFGSKLTIMVDIPGVPDQCEIQCIVRWTKGNVGIGVQFEHLRAIEVWALNKLVHSLENSPH